MNHVVTLWIVPEMEAENQQAIAMVERLPGVKLRIVECPRSMSDWYECPFTKDEEEGSYYGLRGIEFFVNELQRAARTPVAKAHVSNGNGARHC